MKLSIMETPRSERIHIALFGRRNAGKSSLINALTGQPLAIVSDTPGTTADPVYKSIEIFGIGPCVLIDTAGLDDEGELGRLRVLKSRNVLSKADVALLVIGAGQREFELEVQWLNDFKRMSVKPLVIVNKADLEGSQETADLAHSALETEVFLASARTGEGMEAVFQAIRALPVDFDRVSLTGHLVNPGDRVVLVMPQDIQAPKGRLILPQVQVIRDLLDRGIVAVCTTPDTLDQALCPTPDLIITDSQVFPQVYAKKPRESRLTSFSVLMARDKGDIHVFVQGAAAIGRLRDGDRVLIAEACSHNPQDGDIGRIKIPSLLKKRADVQINVVAGQNFPEDLSPYRLVIHCGGCMFNRRYMMNRIQQCVSSGVPITNYGIALAYMGGILEHVEL
jgi:[FeFe] hydrogenase H-cluster maturation GTPase HydF